MRQLTAEARNELNALLKSGVPLDEAMKRVAAWRTLDAQDRTDARERQSTPLVREGTPPDPNLDAFVARLISSGIATPSDLRGASEDEIDAFAARRPHGIPASYRSFLRRIGKNAGRLFKCDHYAVTLDLLDGVEDVARACARKLKMADQIPPDATVICGRLGEQFLFVRGGGDDSPVWWFHEDGSSRKVFGGVLDWLIDVAVECEQAIASGYFEKYPDGTTP